MSGSGYLERRYRRLLTCYPRRYRRRHEEEILAVLLEGASAEQQRPSLADAASLLRSGAAMRLRPGVPRSAPTMRLAVRLMYLGALLELGVLAVVAATAGRLHSAILAHDHSYTTAQWHAEFHQHIVPLEIAAPLAAGVWVWLAWANGRGHGWARMLVFVSAGVTTASLLSGLAGGALTYAPEDAVAGIVLWTVTLAAAALIFGGQARPYYRRTRDQPLRGRHEHSGAFGSAGGSPGA
jgi:hypothetical protein